MSIHAQVAGGVFIRSTWLFAALAITIAGTGQAQLPPKASGAAAVFDVNPDELRPAPSLTVKARAQQAYERGDIVRVIGGTPQDMKRLLGVNVSTSRLNKHGDGAQVIAVRKLNGSFLQYTALMAEPVPPRVTRWQESFETWRSRQTLHPNLVGDPEAPNDAWTNINGSFFDSGGVDETVSVYRLNTKQTVWDYYMVLLDSSVSPSYKECNGVLVGDCGYWTHVRTFELSTGNGYALNDWGPTGTISSESIGFSVGLGLSADGPGIDASFSKTWNQLAVTTTDQSSASTGVAKWTEDFIGRDVDTAPPVTSRSTFLSHQAAIFQVPFGRSFDLSLNASATFWYLGYFNQFVYGAPDTDSVNVTIPVNPPILALSPKTITIAPGESRSISVTATTPGGTEGLSWALTLQPATGLAVSQTTGANNATVLLTVEPNVPIGTVWGVNLQTSPPYGAPAVAQNPLQLTVTAGAAPPVAREGILLTGGESAGVPTSASEVYDSVNNMMVEVGALKTARSAHTATTLSNGKILVAGGTAVNNARIEATATAELYDPDTQSFTAVNGATSCPGVAGCMATARYTHTATLLPNGKVLFAGGTVNGDVGTVTAAAELYDPATMTFSPTGPLLQARAGHSAAWIPGINKVMISGGFYYPVNNTREALMSSEYYDPGTDKFTPGPDLPKGAYGMAGIQDGSACSFCLTGGSSVFTGVTESYFYYFTPSTAIWSASTPLNTSRLGHTVTAVDTEHVLVAGGYTYEVGKDPRTLSTGEINHIGFSDGWKFTSGPMVTARTMHTANVLSDGRIFIAGGQGDTALALGTTEFYDPVSQTFTSGPALLIPRSNHTGTPFVTTNLVTTTALDSGQNPSSYNQSVTLTASVNAAAGGTPTGTITFSDGATALGKIDLTAGSAAYKTSTLAAGSHSITAAYSGSGTYAASASPAISQVVNQNIPVVSIESSANPSASGGNVTFNAKVTSSAGTPQGAVEFFDGPVNLHTGSLQDGMAMFATNALAAGPHIISAKYDGDANFKSEQSPTLSQSVVIATSTVLTSSANPAGPDDAIVFTATVNAATGTPAGTVDFYSDKKLLKAGITMSGGQAVYTKKQLGEGKHSLTAVYRPDANSVYSDSTSPSYIQLVQTTTTTTLTVSPNPANPGATVIFHATVTAAKGNPAGTVDFLDGTAVFASKVSLTKGTAKFSTGTLTQGTHSITAVFTPDTSTNFSGSTSPALTQTVLSGSTTTLTSSANPSLHGQSVIFTATVSGTGGTPSGIVMFTDGGKSLGQGTLSGGKATYSTSSLTSGMHAMVASYGGDTNFGPGKSTTLTQTVNLGTPTVTLQSSQNPSKQGQSVSFTATVKGPDGTAPTGVVIFMDGKLTLGTATISGSAAVYPAPALSAGTHVVTAAYQGDDNFGPVTSAPVSQVVQAQITSTATALTSSLNPSMAGQAVKLTAVVTAATGRASTGTTIPTGTVQFFDNTTTSLGSVPLANGQAQLTISSLTTGTHSITAAFIANSSFAASVSPALTQTVQPAACVPSTVTLTAMPSPSTFGQTVMFMVVAKWSDSGTPVGNVNVSEILPNNGGTKSWATGDLKGGMITLPVDGLPLGTHSMSATYGGDSVTNHCGATSSSLDQVVNAAVSQ